MNKKPAKMIDPPRYPKVTVPIDNEFKKEYTRMSKSMLNMLKVEILNLKK
jgi:hypothetical protein